MLFFKRGAVKFDADLVANSKQPVETIIKVIILLPITKLPGI